MAMTSLRIAAPRCAAAATRSMASKAASHDPPLKLFGIPARYANATYVAASKQGKLEAVEKDLAAFGLLLSKNKDLQTFVTNPTIPRGQAAALMESTFGDKKKTTEVAKNLFVTLAANARLADASKVIEAYVQLMKARRGEVDAVVTTAEPLTAAQQKTVAAALKAKAGAGNVLLETKVDPSLIGGLTVQIGDQFTDLSLRAKIARTKEILNSA